MLISSYYHIFILLIFIFNDAFGKDKIPVRRNRGGKFKKSFGITKKLGREIKLHAFHLRKLLTKLRTGKGSVPPLDAIPKISTSILDREKLFFGDILLMPDQIDALFLYHHKKIQKRPKSSKTKHKRPKSILVGPTGVRILYNEAPFRAQKWGLPITYIISAGSGIVPLLKDAISHIEQHTCIRFNQQPDGINIQKPHIFFNTDQVGCGSHVGQTVGTRAQFINVNKCWKIMGVIVHEICHCLGLLHEQSRNDYKMHVNIIKETIIPGDEINFLPFANASILSPYDFNSVMHYNKFISSINRSATITTKDKLFDKNIGQKTGLSFYDKKTLNHIYCNDTCANKLPCERAGYTDPNNCNQCVCMDGFGGRLCEKTGLSHEKCLPNTQSLIRVTSPKEKCLESPHYDSEGYEPFNECNWYLKSRAGTQISLSFKGNFSVYCDEETQTCFHWVEIKLGNKLVNPGPRFCCQSNPSVNLVSDKNEVVISFRSSFKDGKITSSQMGGFRLCYKLLTERRRPSL